MEYTTQELADKFAVDRKTISRWRKTGNLAEKIKECNINVTSENVTSDNVTSEYPANKPTPNWKRNKNPLTGKKFKDKYDALATACAMTLKEVKGCTLIFGGELLTAK